MDSTALISINRDEIAAWVAFAVLLIGAIAAIVKWIAKPLRHISQMARDWKGYPERPGFPKIPGVMERIESAEHAAKDASYNSKPNGGNSAYDHLMRQAKADKEELQADIASIIDVVTSHIRESEADRTGLHREINMFKLDRSEHHNDPSKP